MRAAAGDDQRPRVACSAPGFDVLEPCVRPCFEPRCLGKGGHVNAHLLRPIEAVLMLGVVVDTDHGPATRLEP